MNNVCDICDKPFSTRNTMLRHRRTVHEPIVSKEKTKACNITKIYNCKYCIKTYKYKQSKWLHEQQCKIIYEQNKQEEMDKEQLTKELKDKEHEIQLLKLELELQHAKEIIAIQEKRQPDSIDSVEHERDMHNKVIKLHNTTINTINNLLEQISEKHGKEVLNNFILPLGDEGLHARLTLENKKQIMSSRKGALNKITELSNCINPQFSNTVLTNIKDKKMFIYCDKKRKFVKENMETVLNDLLYYRVEDLKAILQEMIKIKEISKTEVNHITDLLTNIETNDKYKQSKIECLQELLYSFANTIKRNINDRVQQALDILKKNNPTKEMFNIDDIDDDYYESMFNEE